MSLGANMLIKCNKCKSTGNIDSNQVYDCGRSIRCNKCNYSFIIMTDHINTDLEYTDIVSDLIKRNLFSKDSIDDELSRIIIKKCNALEKTMSNCLEIYYKRAKSYYHIGNYDMALADLGMALHLQPSFSEIYNIAGEIYYKLEDYGNALQNYNKAVSSDLYYIDPLINRAKLYMSIGKFKLYEEDIDRALRLDNNNKAVLDLIIERAGKYPVVDHVLIMKDIDKVLNIDPGHSDALALRFKVNSLLGNNDAIAKDAEDMIDSLKKQFKALDIL